MDIAKAKKWYWWLWLSPLLTFPSLVFLVVFFAFISDPGYEIVCQGTRANCNRQLAEGVTVLIAVMGASLWHLFLLIPALDKDSAFVRWHGRQMLMLAGFQAMVPITLGMIYGLDDEILLSLIGMPLVWFFGNLWGHTQAARGKCSLMAWLGHEPALSPSDPPVRTVSVSTPGTSKNDTARLIDIIRHSRNPQARAKALVELDKLGLVEDF